jgi:hypothetical protein
VKSWTWIDERIASPRLSLTDRAGRWVTEQVGRQGRSVSEVGRELGCDWHTVNGAVFSYGTPLVDDPERIGTVIALGLDATLFCRRGPMHKQEFCTSIVDFGPDGRRLLDVVEGRDAKGASACSMWTTSGVPARSSTPSTRTSGRPTSTWQIRVASMITGLLRSRLVVVVTLRLVEPRPHLVDALARRRTAPESSAPMIIYSTGGSLYTPLESEEPPIPDLARPRAEDHSPA